MRVDVSKRFSLAGGLIAALLLVAACGPVPKPFQPAQGGAESPLAKAGAASGIWIQPIDGASRPMSGLLMGAMIRGFKKYGFNARTGARGNARYRLKGRAAINTENPTLPYVALIHWTLYDFDGQVLGAETQGVSGSRNDWDLGAPAVIADVGEKGPDIIARIIGKEEENLRPIRPKLAGLWMKPIENAPGDGNTSLTRAIKGIIQGAGIVVAEERRYAEYVLEASVILGDPKDGQQRIEIVWAVKTPDGREIGRATQKNLVDAGTFAGPWGEVAGLVAEAALEGIERVLRVAGASPSRLGTQDRVLKTEIPKTGGRETLPPPTLELEGTKRQ